MVGGYTPDKVALRRAIALAYSGGDEIRLPRRNQAITAQGPIPPMAFGYDPKFKTEMSEFNPAKAKALLDMYGYVDKDGDGWRDLPDGNPMVIEYATQPDGLSRELAEIWEKEHGRRGHPHGVQGGQVAGEPEGPRAPAGCRCGAWAPA